MYANYIEIVPKSKVISQPTNLNKGFICSSHVIFTRDGMYQQGLTEDSRLTQHQNHFYDKQIQLFKNKAIIHHWSLLNEGSHPLQQSPKS